MIVFISGGCKNGKSGFAEKIVYNLSKESDKLYYIATMIASDEEDVERIERHRKDREKYNFETLEVSRDMDKVIHSTSGKSTYLLDSVTALLANEMFDKGNVNKDVDKKIIKDLDLLMESAENIVFVSDYIYSEAMIFDDYSELYIKGLATLDKHIAMKSDVVIEVSFGNLTFYKGEKVIKEVLGGNEFELH